MNNVILMGRLTRDPEVRYSQNEKQTAVARFTLAVDRRFKRDGEPDADFIGCVAFGKTGEFTGARVQRSYSREESAPADTPTKTARLSLRQTSLPRTSSLPRVRQHLEPALPHLLLPHLLRQHLPLIRTVSSITVETPNLCLSRKG